MRYQCIESYGDVLGMFMGITWNCLNLRKKYCQFIGILGRCSVNSWELLQEVI